MNFACYVQRPSLSQNSFLSDTSVMLRGSSPRVIRAPCPCMEAKCSDIPKCLWSQLSLFPFMWSGPGGGGKGEMLEITSEVSPFLQ